MTTLCWAIGMICVTYFALTGFALHVYVISQGVETVKARLNASAPRLQQPTTNFVDQYLEGLSKIGSQPAGPREADWK